MDTPIIRFRHGDLEALRTRLLADPSREAFALLLAKTRTVGSCTIVTILDVRHPAAGDCQHQSLTSVSPKKEFVYRVLAEVQQRLDVDTILDAHTHPFSDSAEFSGTDDADEQDFLRFLDRKVEGIGYGSIVLSRRAYQARLWSMRGGRPVPARAQVKTQTAPEAVPEGKGGAPWAGLMDQDLPELQSRTVLAVGLDTLRRICADQLIVLAGVGGLGSVMAENLVHQGFSRIGLIDPDRLEPSNLNRFVGARHADAAENRLKVDVVAEHLAGINPNVQVERIAADVDSPEAEAMMARADWIMLSTDNHASRYSVQRTASTYFVPLVSAGVNITVERDGTGHRLADRSGEVIVVRAGDGFCLHCLGRISLARMAAESHPDPQVREQTVARGYVEGLQVKEPAVKTLNAIIGALAVERLVDQYRQNAVHDPILVYESHSGACLYPDRDTFDLMKTGCALCAA